MQRRIVKYHVGDLVKITGTPPNLSDPAGIDTPRVFRRALGKTFRIAGFGPYSHIDLVVASVTQFGSSLSSSFMCGSKPQESESI